MQSNLASQQALLLSQLIANAEQMLETISQHPDYKSLLEKGYYPDLTLGDAQTALSYLSAEVGYEIYI